MQIGLRQISADSAEQFKESCKAGTASRGSLARELCKIEEWFDYRGKPSEASARKLLPDLAAALKTALPKASARPGDPHVPPAADYPDLALECGLAELGEVSLAPVGESERRQWASMIETHHPEGWRRAPGGQMRYWIGSSRHGILGGIGFAAAGFQMKPRDLFVGWSADAQMANIGRVVCNQRFLILPSVRVRGLASQALRRATERVAGDWEAKYGVRPVLAYSFTGGRHAGGSYRAARWRCCPEKSSGRRSGERRAVWVKPLEEGWRDALRREPARVLGRFKDLYCEGDWAAREYARSSHPDGRIRRRIAAMGAAWQERLGQSLPVIFPEKAEQRAAYRLLSSKGVAMEHILEPHFEATVERCRMERVVLAIQDTTTLNYNGLSATSGLDELGGGGKGASGVLAHCGIAINAAGRPLGMFAMDATFRRAEGKDSARWVEGLARARELSAACPKARVVTVCDREGDFWELLLAAERSGDAILVRASKSAQRRAALPDGSAEDLWLHVAGVEPAGSRVFEVPGCGGPNRRKARKVRLTIRCKEVDLVPPAEQGGSPIRMLAVSAIEENPPRSAARNGKPLHWMLLTTEGEASFESACTALRWYELRWRIERFFHALKTGTRIEDRRLDEADDLRKCLAFDAITAFRVWDLALLAREKPNDPAILYVAPVEVKALAALAMERSFKIPRGPPEAMTISEFAVLVAGQAGFHPSKRQPLPGTQKLWEGLKILSNAIFGHFAILKSKIEIG